MSILNFLVSKSIMYIPGPIVGIFAKGYIAGKTLDDAAAVSKKLNESGAMVTMDILGEFIKTLDEATYYKDVCIKMLDTIKAEGIDGNVSLKPTQMGLNIDDEAAFDNIRAIVSHAASLGNFIRIDMEDTPFTEKTLELYEKLRNEFPGHVGVVLQSYLRRTPDDIDRLAKGGQMNLRLCKGIYNEPREFAYKDMMIVNRNFTYSLEKIFKAGGYVGIATHDEKLVFEALRLIEQHNVPQDRYEFQMLYGVDEQLRKIIIDSGHRLRVYVPFGKDWLPYSKRRLKENPSIATHALRQLLGIHGK